MSIEGELGRAVLALVGLLVLGFLALALPCWLIVRGVNRGRNGLLVTGLVLVTIQVAAGVALVVGIAASCRDGC